MNSGGRRGNMYVKTKIEIPVNLNKKEKDLLGEVDELISNKKNSPDSEGFFKKMGDLFN
jgi:molecular chaperone DnaJ